MKKFLHVTGFFISAIWWDFKCLMGFHRMRWFDGFVGKPKYKCVNCTYQEPTLIKRVTKL